MVDDIKISKHFKQAVTLNQQWMCMSKRLIWTCVTLGVKSKICSYHVVDNSIYLGNAHSAVAKLLNIWKSNQYTMKTKLRLYNSNVKAILLCGSECWWVVKGDMATIEAIHNGCLRKICQIFWPNKISNVDLHKKTGCNSAVLEIKCWGGTLLL